MTRRFRLDASMMLRLLSLIFLIGALGQRLAEAAPTDPATTTNTPDSPLSPPKGSSWHSLIQLNRSFTERECVMCKFSVGLVNYGLKTKRGADQLYRIANNFCTLAHYQTPLVCSNITKLFEQEIAKVLAYGILTPSQVCGLLSNNTCGSYHNPMADWEVDIDASSALDQDEMMKIRQSNLEERRRISTDQDDKPFKVIHISDTHLDLQYQEGSFVDCAEPLCCRASSTPKSTSHIKAGRWGSPDCDSPMHTFEAALKALNETIQASGGDVKYIIWTGDLKPHDVWIESKDLAIKTYEKTFDKIYTHIPNIRIFPTLGNHEMIPVDSFSPSNLLDIARRDSPEWVYKVLDGYWSRWLPDETVKTIMKDGIYAVHVLPGLKIISLNTNFCHSNNFWLYINSTDPGNQLQWLVHELQMSELTHEKVHIIGHIPPGAEDCFKVWSRNYNRILRRYASTITGQFFGHTHMDHFQMFYSRDDNDSEQIEWNPIGVGLIGPSVTPFTGSNSAFRVYTIDPNQGFAPIDYQNYHMNLTLANENPQEEPKWLPQEPFSSLLGAKDITPQSMHELLLQVVNEIQNSEPSSSDANKFLNANDQLQVSKKGSVDKLQKLYRLFSSYSDTRSTLNDFNKMSKLDKQKFLCPYFSGQSHNMGACRKFVNDKLTGEDAALVYL